VLEQRQPVQDGMHRLAQLAKVAQRPQQELARPVEITDRSELSRQQQARAGIDLEIGTGALE
jgi:hypothetical protein